MTGRLDAFALRDEVITTYSDYVQGFIKIADSRVRQEVDDALQSGSLWPEPWVQINPTYLLEADTDQLIDERNLFDPALRPSFSTPDGTPWQFYRHQVEAFERARNGRSYVMTTGTGSGKSVTYIAPIIDHVLRTKTGKNDRSIRAIIVYPMNALANSQLEALRRFLPGGCVHDAVDDDGVYHHEQITSDVTFARYTGQEDRNFRQALVENPPDILLTNYVMLELLLTGVWDRNLLGNSDKLKYVVLDELHTYRGRQGADVALLLRRVANAAGKLKGADRTDQLLYVGTSATMSSDGTPAEQRKAVADVVSTLFGVDVDPDDVIGETLERVTDEAALSDDALHSVITGGWTAPTTFEQLRVDPVCCWVESRIGVARDSEGTLRRQTPAQLTTLATELAEATGAPVGDCRVIGRDAITAGDAIEVPGSNGRRAFPFRLHQFVSRGDNVYVSMEHPDSRHVTLDEQQYVPGDRGRSLFNLASAESAAPTTTRSSASATPPVAWSTCPSTSPRRSSCATGTSGSSSSAEPRTAGREHKADGHTKLVAAGRRGGVASPAPRAHTRRAGRQVTTCHAPNLSWPMSVGSQPILRPTPSTVPHGPCPHSGGKAIGRYTLPVHQRGCS